MVRLAQRCAWQVRGHSPAQWASWAGLWATAVVLEVMQPGDVRSLMPPMSWNGPRMPDDPDEVLEDLEVQAHGTPSWLAPRRALAVPLRLTGRGALLDVPVRFSSEVVELPLSRLRVSAASPTRWTLNPRCGRTRWRLVLAERDPDPALGDPGQLVVTGPWVAMAWLGTLADWPQPEAGPRVPAP